MPKVDLRDALKELEEDNNLQEELFYLEVYDTDVEEGKKLQQEMIDELFDLSDELDDAIEEELRKEQRRDLERMRAELMAASIEDADTLSNDVDPYSYGDDFDPYRN